MDFRLGKLLHFEPKRNVIVNIQMREQGVPLENGVHLPLMGRDIIYPFPIKKDIPAMRR